MSMLCDTWMCRLTSLTSVGLLLLSSGCQTTNRAQSGAIVGSGWGAMTGAIIGSHSGHAEGGALIGAAAGALVGGLAGEAEDARAERDAAIAQAAYAQQAITNLDVIQLSQSGVSDDVITSTMRSQGGRFDLSPQAIITLKNSGISDRVILEMQNHGRLVPPPLTAVIQEPRVVVVPPGPQFQFSIGSGPHHRRHHHHHWQW